MLPYMKPSLILSMSSVDPDIVVYHMAALPNGEAVVYYSKGKTSKKIVRLESRGILTQELYR